MSKILAEEPDGWLGMIYGSVGPHLSITDHGITLNLPVTKGQSIQIEEWGKQVKWAQGAAAVAQARRVDENTSDGYHTFRELYDFRRLFNAALFNEWAAQGKYEVHKSFKHHDGELAFGGGWFVVMATLPTGQISNHYEANAWSQFHIEVRERADEWDGHTPQDVLQRLAALSATDDGGER